MSWQDITRAFCVSGGHESSVGRVGVLLPHANIDFLSSEADRVAEPARIVGSSTV